MNRSVFLALCRPMMSRKYPKSYTYKGLPKYDIDSVLRNGEKQVYDLTTEAHNFICDGFIVHNCESGRHGVIWGSMTRYEPLDKVEAQIKDIVGMGFTGLAYYDDIFILNKQRTEKLLDLHVKYNLAFRCFLRSDILQKHGGKEYLHKMKDAGLIEIFVGVESASNQIKNNIHKGTIIEQDTNVVNWCHELGVLPKCSLILGLPGETRETMETTRQWILQQDPSRIRIQVDRLIPFKGTPLTDHPEDYDLKYEQQPDEEWFFKGRMDLDTHSFVSTSNLSVQEIDDFWRSLENEMREKGYRS